MQTKWATGNGSQNAHGVCWLEKRTKCAALRRECRSLRPASDRVNAAGNRCSCVGHTQGQSPPPTIRIPSMSLVFLTGASFSRNWSDFHSAILKALPKAAIRIACRRTPTQSEIQIIFAINPVVYGCRRHAGKSRLKRRQPITMPVMPSCKLCKHGEHAWIVLPFFDSRSFCFTYSPAVAVKPCVPADRDLHPVNH